MSGHTHIHTHTYTHDNYYSPLCACAPRVNDKNKLMVSHHMRLEGIADLEMDDRFLHTGLVVVVSDYIGVCVHFYFVDQITVTSCGIENLSDCRCSDSNFNRFFS